VKHHLASAIAISLLAAIPASAQVAATVQNVPDMPYEAVPGFFHGIPAGDYLGEMQGIATNSKGHVFAFFRGPNSRLWEFDQTGKYDLAQLRSLQDWYLRYQIASVEGVAEVASLGGFVRQYQVNIDPNRLAAYRLSPKTVVDAVRMGNNEVGGRSIELSGAEYMIRGRGYIRSVKDIEATVRVSGKTGVEMEAMTAVAVAGLTIYDMCKAVDREMSVTEVRLIQKSGGKSGTFLRDE